MRKTIFLYGLLLAVLVFVLKMIEYRMLVRDLATDTAFGAIAAIFLVLGVWAGRRLTLKPTAAPLPGAVADIPLSEAPILNDDLLKQTGISRREYEVLELMARGLSNQEIADALFVSLNTVKTHSSNLFIKLNVKRRTQAVQQARAIGVLKNA